MNNKFQFNKKVFLAFFSVLLIGMIAGSSLAVALTPTQTFALYGGNYPGATTYTAWASDGQYYVKNQYGVIVYSDTDNGVLNDALAILSGSDWQTVKVLGDWTITEQIAITKDFTILDLTEATLTLEDAFDDEMIYAESIDYIQINGGYIDGNKAGQTVYTPLIALIACNYATIQNGVHVNAEGTCVTVGGSDDAHPATYIKILNNEFRSSDGDNVYIGYSAKYVTIANNFFYAPGDTAIATNGVTGCVISNNQVVEPVSHCITVTGGSATIYETSVTITGNTLTMGATLGTGIFLGWGPGRPVYNVAITGNTITGGGYGMRTYTASVNEGIVVTGNQITGTAREALLFDATTNLIISDNQLIDNCISDTANYNQINLSNSVTQAIVSGNNIIGACKFGIAEAGSSDYNFFDGNYIEAGASGSIYSAGAHSNSTNNYVI